MLIISVILNIVKENSSCFNFLSGGVGNFRLKKTLIDLLEILWQRRKNMFWKRWKAEIPVVYSHILNLVSDKFQ